jgi:hypothetical protein
MVLFLFFLINITTKYHTFQNSVDIKSLKSAEDIADFVILRQCVLHILVPANKNHIDI